MGQKIDMQSANINTFKSLECTILTFWPFLFLFIFFKDKILCFSFFKTLFTFYSCALFENIVTSELFTVLSVYVLINKFPLQNKRSVKFDFFFFLP